MLTKLCLVLVLCLVKAQDDQFPRSLARVGQICPGPEDTSKRNVCHFSHSKGTITLQAVNLESVNPMLQSGDSLPGHFAPDGNIYDCDCKLVDPTEFPCKTDDCCKSSPLINEEMSAHADSDCPTSVGDKSLIGCVEFTGCRYDIEPCKTNECCRNSPLVNPDLPVEFNDECPAQNGDASHGGCVEFTKCKYVDFRCASDECCATDKRVHANGEFTIHFDPECPVEDGDPSVIGCIAFTGCKYGEDDALPCHTDECCREISVTNHDPALNVHVDENCPKVDGDTSLVGCVEFTGCRYNVDQCDSDDCCAKNALRNPSLPVVFNSECPAKNGDKSIVGCIEFTQCQYVEQFEDHTPCTDDACCVANEEVPHNANIGVHFDATCPQNPGDEQHNGCVGFTGCRVGTADACNDDICCDINLKVNHDPRLHVHFDENCPKVDGDTSLVGCVEFTQCRYDVEQCESTECCEKNVLRNPDLPVVFNADCPKVDGDTSIVGCIEFTQCQYQTVVPENSLACTDDDCCRDSDEVNHNPLLAVHFDPTCPTADGQVSHSECVGLTGCRYGPIPACASKECCENIPVVNRDLDIDFDENCPTTEADSSLVGCVQFTGCRYVDVDAACKTDDCCSNLKIRNPDLPVVFSDECPLKDGDVSVVGCIEFTRCRYTESFPESLSCFGKADQDAADACCDANVIVNHDLEIHFDNGCPAKDGDVSVVGCVEFTGCKYEAEPCETQECCDESSIVNHDPSLHAHVDADCPAQDGDVSLVGCVEFTQCRYGAVEACQSDECCAKNALRNPEIPVVFDANCPAVNGDVSLVGCIEFTQCRYSTEPTPEDLACKTDDCCALNKIVNHDPSLGIHFDASCPAKDGDFSVIGCVEFTQCRYGPPVCKDTACCQESSITNHDPRLNVHFDENCPKVDGDKSLIGCVEFTQCRYDVDQCEEGVDSDACCAKNVLRNPSLPVKFNADCPRQDGDVSIVGCIEFTGCQYVDVVPEEQVCSDDFCCATTTNIDPSTGVHFDETCPTTSDAPSHGGCIGLTGCAIGATPACKTDACCDANTIVNHDPSLDAHFDEDCPINIGDPSVVGCVEFTGCKYSDVGCKTDDCCEKNGLRNPSLPVVFDDSCPLKNGDVSKVGCIEFTQCRYTVTEETPTVVCEDDVCCVKQLELLDISGASIMGAHFDSECPTVDGADVVVGCVGFTGCRLGADFDNPCQSDECCKAHPLVNQDKSLNAHFDANCPVNEGDTSVIGCVEFSGCRYGNEDSFCTTQQCCDNSVLVNHDIEHVGLAAPDASCPQKNGDVSVIGCVEFTGCRYPPEEGVCSTNDCCDANPLVNHDPSLGAHVDADCPVKDTDTSLVGCVEFTKCRYFTMTCSDDDCCLANPLVQPDDSLAIHFDPNCPKAAGDPTLRGCVDFTRCRFGDADFIKNRNLLRASTEGSSSSSGLGAGDIAAILLAVILFATFAGVGYFCVCKKKKSDSDYIAMDHRQSA